MWNDSDGHTNRFTRLLEIIQMSINPAIKIRQSMAFTHPFGANAGYGRRRVVGALRYNSTRAYLCHEVKTARFHSSVALP